MKITKSKLRRIIKEELNVVLGERSAGWPTVPPEHPKDASGVYIQHARSGTKKIYKKDMQAFVAKEFKAGMSGDSFDRSLEKFEVKFSLNYPDSIYKLHDTLKSIGDEGLATKLRRLYPGEFEGSGSDY